MQTAKLSKKLIILTGGGTGGHVFPLLSVGRELKKNNPEIELEYMGSGLDLERKAAQAEGIKYQKIFCGKFRRYINFWSIFQNFFDFFLFLAGFFQSLYLVGTKKPAVIFSKGGFVSLPVVLAASLKGVPVILHESDILPGLANRIAARFSRRIAVAFPLTAMPREIRFRAFYAGLPVNEKFEKSFEMLPRSGEYILVVGGSSGAEELNQLIYKTAEKIVGLKPIIHITGPANLSQAAQFKARLPESIKKFYTPIGFSHDMDEMISDASLVISRAGATAIFEAAACHKKALFVPIRKEVTAHQVINARYLKENGFAEVFEHNQGSEEFIKLIKKLLDSKEKSQLDQIFFPSSSAVMARAISDELDRLKLKQYKNIFLIGVDGVSMKGIAEILKKMGKRVSGSDLKIAGHSKENITPDLDLVIYSSAADESSAARDEHEEARRLKIPIIKRPEAIALLMKGHTGISVSGMHGKTTISTLVARIFDKLIYSPSYLIGATSTQSNKTVQLGRGEHFIAEACEYDDAFLSFPTKVALISNIEEEHLDFFEGGLEEIKKHFSKFVGGIYAGGCLVYCADDLNTYDVVKDNSSIIRNKKIQIISYGFKPSADFAIDHYRADGTFISFDITARREKHNFRTTIPGKHFALNCAGALALSSYFGISEDIAKEVFEKYTGAARRFVKVGTRAGVALYDDYAHHPTEVVATLSALIDLKSKGRKIVIFQPHQQNRLNNLYLKFVSAFAKSKEDVLIILPVFKVPGRDEGEKEVHTSAALVEDINIKSQKNAIYAENYDAALKIVQKESRKGDIILTMGATDVYKISEKYLRSR